MPTVLCHSCEKPITLPDSWVKSAYTCPYCGTVVPLSAAPDAPTLPAPPRRTQSQPVAPPPPPIYIQADDGPKRNAFTTMFGGAVGATLGCAVGAIILLIVVVAFCAGGKPR